MKIQKIPFSDLPMLAKTDRAYAENDPTLRPFFQHDVNMDSFQNIMKTKQHQNINRTVLAEVLTDQAKYFESFLKKNKIVNHSLSNIYNQIEKFEDENTFCVTTAHQPSLFLGPMYFIYKIISTIRLSEELNRRYPTAHVVPVFVIGGEDHDFDEVNHIHIFNKKIEWKLPDTGGGGSVGAMTTESLAETLSQLQSILGESESAVSIFEIIKKCYTENVVYQEATQCFLYQLFAKYGLVVVNMTDGRLKKLFVPAMKLEIFEEKSKPLVEKTQLELNELGFKSQAFARPINLFWLETNTRARIVREGDAFSAIGTTQKWTKTELETALETTPQYFSPNVVMRPLFQETILPNLAYVGGGGELAYWLERKRQFEAFEVPFPMLMRRNSAQFVDKNAADRAQKLGLSLTDLMQDEQQMTKFYIKNQSESNLSLEKQKLALENLFSEIAELAKSVDPTLEKAVLAESTKQRQSLDQLESRIARAEKQKYETALQQIRNLSQKLFPNGGLQERFDNFLPYYLKYGDSFFDILKENLNPLDAAELVVLEM